LLALQPIILELRARLPDSTLVVSTMTNSGYAIAEDKIRRHVDGITYVPYDLPGATRRAVEAIRPDLLVLEYTEVWPNLIGAARAFGAAVAMTNGRFSEALMWRYRVFYALIGNPLRSIDLLLMREGIEAERAIQLGAPRERVRVTGNTKFDNVSKGPDDAQVASLRQAFALGESEPLFVAGSTHEGEERPLLEMFQRLKSAFPRLRMVIAPRYIERGARVASFARGEGFSVALRSEPGPAAQAEVLVLDTIGELNAAYRLATLVFVGGSFVPRGGQNILEPAGQGRPVLFGPHMMNFRDSVEVLLGRGGIQVQTPSQLERVGRELLSRPDEISRLGTMAMEAVRRVSGASRRNAEELLALLGRSAAKA
jgi:3-deoxy-D-manno-octulosonic-acid transferase